MRTTNKNKTELKNTVLPILNFFTGFESGYFHSVSQNLADCFTCNLFTSGDYSGSPVQTANREKLLSMKRLVKRTKITELNEAYSTSTVLFPIKALEDLELLKTLAALSDYPCIDEERVSEIERELEDECFESFGHSDFERHLKTIDDINGDLIDAMTIPQLKTFYYNCAASTNYNVFTPESGTSGHFDFENFGGLGAEKAIELFKNELAKIQLEDLAEKVQS